MEREATKIKIRYPLVGNSGFGIDSREVGIDTVNPDNKPDVVEHILLKEEWGRVVEITWRDFGKEWILNHIETIEFSDAEYRNLQAKKKRDREPSNPARIKKVLNQDSQQKR